MRLTSLASSSSLSALESESDKQEETVVCEDLGNGDETNHISQVKVSIGRTKGSIGPGGEKRLFDADIEDEGALKILSALNQEEAKYLSDENMPLRHFRAEKVSIAAKSSRVMIASVLTHDLHFTMIISISGKCRKGHLEDQGNSSLAEGLSSGSNQTRVRRGCEFTAATGPGSTGSPLDYNEGE